MNHRQIAAEIRQLRQQHDAWCSAWEQLKSYIAEDGPTGGHYLRQPRVPRGDPDGGQWTDGGGGGDASIQRVFSKRPGKARTAIETALTVFTWLSARNTADRQAIIRFSREYTPDGRGDINFEDPVVLRDEEVAAACPQLGTVQEETDRADAIVSARPGPMPPAIYGTYVHTALSRQIRALNDPNLVSELSAIKGRAADAAYGTRGSIRIDVLENVGDGTVCIYDIKTGRSGLTARRAQEIVTNVYAHFPRTRRFVVTDVRPMR